MSLWTQITGLVVVKNNTEVDSGELVAKVLGPMSTWENWHSESTIPSGSEGGIEYFVSDSIHEDEVNILFNGNLRDFSCEETLMEWISDDLSADKFTEQGLEIVKGTFAYETGVNVASKFKVNTSTWEHVTNATGKLSDKIEQKGEGKHSYQVVGAIQLDNFGFLLNLQNRVGELNRMLPKFTDNALELKAVITGADHCLQNVSILINGNMTVADKIKPLVELIIDEIEKVNAEGYGIRTAVVSVRDESNTELTVINTNSEDWEKF